MQIWDTAGQERFKNITSSYYRGGNGVLVVYDITDRESFENLTSWLIEIEKNANKNVYKLLIGNKCDLEDKRKISIQEGKEFAESNGMKFIETSAKNDTKVQEAFELLTSEIIKANINKEKGLEKKDKAKAVHLSPKVEDISGKKIVKTKEIDSKEKFDPNKNIQYALMKQKYFNPKSKMCELQDNCPYYLKGEECPNGAHQISELKFESQINENIKLRKNLISTLDKAPEPIIKKPWVHTGRLISCGMADGSGGGKCICGFCKYRARNYDEGMEKKLRKMAREKNEKILKKRDERIKKQKSEVKK